MSANLAINHHKFVVFGSGYDNTRANSGNGAKYTVFSHPNVPLGSEIHKLQFFFLVPEDGSDLSEDTEDAVITYPESCTFTPTIGSTFDTVGTTTVSVVFEREYYDSESGEYITIRREYSQMIEVVNHGNIADSGYGLDVYEDGYAYCYEDTIDLQNYDDDIVKISAPPWRGYDLHYGALPNLEDITELALVDADTLVSSCGGQTIITSFTNDTSLQTLEGVESLVKHIGFYTQAFAGCTALEDISALAELDTSAETSFEEWFNYCTSLTDISPLSNWDTSNITSMEKMFFYCDALDDISPLNGWDFSNVSNMYAMFHNTGGAKDASDAQSWNVSGTDMHTFSSNWANRPSWN